MDNNIKFYIRLYLLCVILFIALSHPYFAFFGNNVFNYLVNFDFVSIPEWSFLTTLVIGCLFSTIVLVFVHFNIKSSL
jgi:hypothetical protein